jgi:hypothetical protein
VTTQDTRLPKTGRGRQTVRPDGFYEPDPPLHPTGGQTGLDVVFCGEDGRSRTYRFGTLPFPALHLELADAFATRVGPSGGRRTLASANIAWRSVSELLKFLAELPRPPRDLAGLRRSHLERLRRHRLLTCNDIVVVNEMTELFHLLRHVDQRRLRPEVWDLIHQRGHHQGHCKRGGLPGYSDREFEQIVRAARSRVVEIRDRIRAGEQLLALADTDPGQLTDQERHEASWLAGMARSGTVPGQARIAGSWPMGNLPDTSDRNTTAQRLFLTPEDLVPLLVLMVAVSERNGETIKELHAAHRVLEGRAVAVGSIKRRRGKALSRATLHWEIGSDSRQLHTPGGLYLLIHQLTERSRTFSGTDSLWAIWTTASGHIPAFGTDLGRSLRLSKWAARQGLTSDVADEAEPEPLILRLDRIKTAAEVRRAKATGGHMPSTATTNTMDVSYLHYLRNDPVIHAWAEDIVDVALSDAEGAARAFQLKILGPQIQDQFEADPQAAAREVGTTVEKLGQALAGDLDTLAASCLDIDHNPFSTGRCGVSFLTCLRCPNALVLERHLPMLYLLLDHLQAQLDRMSVLDWCRLHGVTWLIITRLILPRFSLAQRQLAQAAKPDVAPADLLDLLDGPREQR